MKFNWGHKILLIYLSFVSMIGVLVYKSTKVHFDLVSDDYYDQEVKYQSRINNLQNTFSLIEKPVSFYNQDEEVVELKFPESLNTSSINGEVMFFKPDNASLDFTVKIDLDKQNIQKIAIDKLTRGYWKLKTTWNTDNTSYYQEENIFIN